MKRLGELVLLPAPRAIENAPGAFTPNSGTSIVLRDEPARLSAIGARLADGCRNALGLECAVTAEASHAREANRILLGLDPGLPLQGYRLRVTPSEVSIRGQAPAAVFHGAATLQQMLEQCDGSLPAGEIVDSPDFPVRGVMLDVSRCKVPTMDTLFALVDMFAGLKLNHLQLYTEHTFAYTGHEQVWAEASPLTGGEIQRLDEYCRERFIELAPNQNSFGHMTRWLVHPRYRGLAECREGFDWPWGGRSSEPFSLDPTNPGSLALLEGLYAELLPHFSSRLFNVGCDETFDVGQGRNRELCARVGRGRVYLDFLLKVHDLVKRHGRTMLFWGDIIMEHPELVAEIPRDTIALEWGYEAEHPFVEHSARFADSGIPFWVCPGTSSWNSIAGRTDNCLANIRAAVRGGLAHGASGCLTTDWGDNGHWQVLPVSFPGFAAGAAFSWCLESSAGQDLAAALDLHVFRDRASVLGKLCLDLGNAYQRAGGRLHNASHLFQILRSPPGSPLPASVSAESLEETRRFVESAAAPLEHARMDRADSALVRDEMAFTVRLLLLACERGLARQGSPVRRTTGEKCAFGAGQDPSVLTDRLVGGYERLWLARNRTGGLRESAGSLRQAIRASVE